MDSINLNEKGFWKELGIKPSRDLDTNIEKFYSRYSKEIGYSLNSRNKGHNKFLKILKTPFRLKYFIKFN